MCCGQNDIQKGNFTYIRYATDKNGSNFSKNRNDVQHKRCYQAIYVSDVELDETSTLFPNYFNGLWFNICDVEQSKNDDLRIMFEWGIRKEQDVKDQLIIKRSDFFSNEYGLILDYELLTIKLSNFDTVKDKNPVLLIDRYKSKKYRGMDPISEGSTTDERKYRRAGYKHEIDPQSNNRINEIPLLNSIQDIDFNQDRYFRFQSGYVYPSGSPKMHNRTRRFNCGWCYLSFRVRYVEDGKVIETGSLGQLRMMVNGIYDDKTREKGQPYRLTYNYK